MSVNDIFLYTKIRKKTGCANFEITIMRYNLTKSDYKIVLCNMHKKYNLKYTDIIIDNYMCVMIFLTMEQPIAHAVLNTKCVSEGTNLS